jgi:hypothetical protein
MNTSIAKAFVKAQKEFGPALKTANNPHFLSKYADLSACVEAVIDALNNNGISLIQKNHPSDDGVIVETVFLHESGEELSCGQLHVPAAKQDPQGYGSALTYARRYSLMAACGIAPEDDDGNAASKKPEARPKADTQPIDTAAAEKNLTEAVKKGTAELRKVWGALDEATRMALMSKLDGWKKEAKKQDEALATQA